MTLAELLLFLIFSVLLASYFNYFGVEKKNKSSSPEVMLIRLLIWIALSGAIVWGLYKVINIF
ncbi:hypothetical protein [Candidatus Pelagibacter sp. HIMB1587]|uniref:hypothetical protein n=1 Tax=Candidatus Pelagibacter sp. HIMB1587 TaxID=3413354 RepID=UPI003F8512FC